MCNPMVLHADGLIHDLQDKYDALIIPGGLKGAETLSQSTEVQTLVREYYEGTKIVAMICAGTSKTPRLHRR